MLYIVGIGPGNKDYMIKKSIDILERADYIVGFKRALDSLDFVKAKKIYISSLKDFDEFIKEDSKYKDKVVCIPASGDPTFYGISNYIIRNTKASLEVIPGISSFQYLTSKMCISWNKAFLGSLHGREDDFIQKVRENKVSIWLTDKINTPRRLCTMLNDSDIECKVVIGEDLSYDNERINVGKPSQYLDIDSSELNIVLVIKD